MDDLVVIILTILIAIVGAIGQIRKKKTQQTEIKDKPESPGFWDMLEDEIDYATQPEQPVGNQQPKPNVVNTEPGQDYIFDGKKEGTSVKEEKVKSKFEAPEEKTDIKKERFSLRKAVIYSEILNRKYK